MDNTDLKVLDSKETFRCSLPAIIEVFVEFYGEESREEIVSSFNNLLFFENNSLNKMKERIERFAGNLYSDISEKYIDALLKAIPSLYPSKARLLFGSSEYNCPLKHLMAYKNGKIDRESLLHQTYGVGEETVDNLLEIVCASDQVDEIYDSFQSSLASANSKYRYYKELINDIRMIDDQLKRKYISKLREKVKSVGNDGTINDILIYLGNIPNPLDVSDIDSFSSALCNGECPDFVKKSRVRLYNNIRSFNLRFHKSFEQFEKEMISITDKIDEIIKIRDELNFDFQYDFYYRHPIYKENRNEIDSKGLVISQNGYYRSVVDRSTSVIPNLIETESGFEFFPILSMDEGYQDCYLDVSLIHELNHIKEFYLLNTFDDHFAGITGWDYLVQPYSLDDVKNVDTFESGDYTEFSEIINELIAQDITTLMHKRGVYVFNTERNARISGSSLYENVRFLVQDFYDTYKEDIIASRSGGHISVIFDKVGKENFDALSFLVDQYQERFDTRGREVNNAYKLGADNEDTRFIKELVEKRDHILEAMATYSKSNEQIDSRSI